MEIYLIFGAGPRVRGAFDTYEGAHELASDLAYEEFNNGKTSSHFVIEKWSGETNLGIVGHVYGFDVEKERGL